MTHIAKWSVVAVSLLTVLAAVAAAMQPRDRTDAERGAVLLGVIAGLWVAIASIAWWQP